MNEGKPDTHITTCQKLLDLQQTHSVYIDNIPVHPELSIGVAWSKMDRHDIDHLFSNAELAATQARYDP